MGQVMGMAELAPPGSAVCEALRDGTGVQITVKTVKTA
jgi:hypothetical protein